MFRNKGEKNWSINFVTVAFKLEFNVSIMFFKQLIGIFHLKFKLQCCLPSNILIPSL